MTESAALCLLDKKMKGKRMENCLISVIVTVYNAEIYLKTCIDSVLTQSYQNIEVILVDDGSTDGSRGICDDLAKKDSRVHVIHKKNEGVAEARKTGYKASVGAYVSMIDADDWLEKDMLEKLYRTAVEQDVSIVMCGRFEESDSGSKPVKQGIRSGRYAGSRMETEIFPYMIVNQKFFEWGLFPSYWDKLFRRDALMPYIFRVDSRIPMGNDAAGVYPALLHAESIYIMDECFYHYRQTDHSMVRTFDRNRNKREGFRILYRSVLKEFESEKTEYCLRDQWLEYLLFLMIPRADELYEGMNRLDYLFPFPGVKRNSRIMLYGMGLYGQRLYRYLKRTGFCQVEAAVDQNYKALQKKDLPVISPENIGDYDFDAIVVALSFAGAANAVKEHLSTAFPEEKIHLIDTKIIKEEHTLQAFGLI